ncbi:hypothetical protein DSO57_1035748 [Entomophthora muscae]|uniref:Uncharacterized protein n=1 Tax=Entomophthora muscae TaxID=34485 RepID=A0ACC2S1D3_9FUNG|nr:hypothetical protein DSO57_1035748 [Entomophthora muscae]
MASISWSKLSLSLAPPKKDPCSLLYAPDNLPGKAKGHLQLRVCLAWNMIPEDGPYQPQALDYLSVKSSLMVPWETTGPVMEPQSPPDPMLPSECPSWLLLRPAPYLVLLDTVISGHPSCPLDSIPAVLSLRMGANLSWFSPLSHMPHKSLALQGH